MSDVSNHWAQKYPPLPSIVRVAWLGCPLSSLQETQPAQRTHKHMYLPKNSAVTREAATTAVREGGVREQPAQSTHTHAHTSTGKPDRYARLPPLREGGVRESSAVTSLPYLRPLFGEEPPLPESPPPPSTPLSLLLELFFLLCFFFRLPLTPLPLLSRSLSARRLLPPVSMTKPSSAFKRRAVSASSGYLFSSSRSHLTDIFFRPVRVFRHTCLPKCDERSSNKWQGVNGDNRLIF